MTIQRKRLGTPAVFYPITKRLDARSNERKEPDLTKPLYKKVWQIPQRGAKAEVTGQMTINVIRIGCGGTLPGIHLDSRVEFDGTTWDVVSPPSFHNGANRHTTHWSMDVRERP